MKWKISRKNTWNKTWMLWIFSYPHSQDMRLFSAPVLCIQLCVCYRICVDHYVNLYSTLCECIVYDVSVSLFSRWKKKINLNLVSKEVGYDLSMIRISSLEEVWFWEKNQFLFKDIFTTLSSKKISASFSLSTYFYISMLSSTSKSRTMFAFLALMIVFFIFRIFANLSLSWTLFEWDEYWSTIFFHSKIKYVACDNEICC